MLILDEPTAGLDPRGCEDILSLLRRYHTQRGSTVVLVSHSMEEIARNAQRIIVLDQGRRPHAGHASGGVRPGP